MQCQRAERIFLANECDTVYFRVIMKKISEETVLSSIGYKKYRKTVINNMVRINLCWITRKKLLLSGIAY